MKVESTFNATKLTTLMKSFKRIKYVPATWETCCSVIQSTRAIFGPRALQNFIHQSRRRISTHEF